MFFGRDFLPFFIEWNFLQEVHDLGLRIDSETHEKLKSLAEYDGRSINGEVLYLIRQAIKAHEKEVDK